MGDSLKCIFETKVNGIDINEGGYMANWQAVPFVNGIGGFAKKH